MRWDFSLYDPQLLPEALVTKKYKSISAYDWIGKTKDQTSFCDLIEPKKMKSINELRNLLESGHTNYTGTTVINTETVTDLTGAKYNAEIIHGWDIGFAMQCDETWGDFHYRVFDYISTKNESEREALLESCHLEDAHWQWLSKHRGYHSDQYEWFYLMGDDNPQASCLVYHPKKSACSDDDIFYIEFLAVAPWNRPNPLDKQKFKGLGSLLLKNVICHIEKHQGLVKGFSLHSLPKAEGFYTKIGMVRMNQLDKGSMAYFEMLEKPKQSFLGETA
ncbi:GNAT family N-acetyltransferase [Neptunomonas sp.]|uniref:GNAT family N-acetyltransferase n=1 Tax=Neptunomonas sp. TaxID=1971898 RepID=UPI0025F878E6|nr:GNAT family N-acetyltransferase [Neptunomonas sp.]